MHQQRQPANEAPPQQPQPANQALLQPPKPANDGPSHPNGGIALPKWSFPVPVGLERHGTEEEAPPASFQQAPPALSRQVRIAQMPLHLEKESRRHAIFIQARNGLRAGW